MKDYEKAAVAIGVAALGLAAYQAIQAKKAVDAQETTDTKKDPVTAAVDLTQHVVGGTLSWFRQRYDDAVGKVKGRSEDIIDTIKATPGKVVYTVTGAVDYGKDATEAGTKYLWNIISGSAASGKQKLEQLTNKPFTLMGSFAEKFTISNPLPSAGQSIDNVLTGVGSKLEFVEKKTSGTKDAIAQRLSNMRDRLFRVLRR